MASHAASRGRRPIPSEDPVVVPSYDPSTIVLRAPFEDEDWFYTSPPEVQTTFERDYWHTQAQRLAGKATRLQERIRQMEADRWREQHRDRVVRKVVNS